MWSFSVIKTENSVIKAEVKERKLSNEYTIIEKK